MKINQIVFSPTGGTQKAADIIAEALGNVINKIDLTDPKNDYSAFNFGQDDIAVIAIPSYSGRVPALAAERLGKINGSQSYCVVVCVYGNRAYDDTLLELSDIAKQCNFNVIAGIAAVAEHSIVRQYAAGRPNQRDIDELQGFAEKILEKIKKGDDNEVHLPGNNPYRKHGKGGMVPKADDNCDNCGLCAEKCPAQAISKDNIKTADDKCISCMRCVSVCPKSARKVNSVAVSAVALALKKACSVVKNNELYI